MKHGGDADLRAETLGIGRDGDRGLGRRLNQEIVDDTLVLPGDVAQRRRQRVDDMEVADGEQLGGKDFAPGQNQKKPGGAKDINPGSTQRK